MRDVSKRITTEKTMNDLLSLSAHLYDVMKEGKQEAEILNDEERSFITQTICNSLTEACRLWDLDIKIFRNDSAKCAS